MLEQVPEQPIAEDAQPVDSPVEETPESVAGGYRPVVGGVNPTHSVQEVIDWILDKIGRD
jgi:hypothetical protein